MLLIIIDYIYYRFLLAAWIQDYDLWLAFAGVCCLNEEFGWRFNMIASRFNAFKIKFLENLKNFLKLR